MAGQIQFGNTQVDEAARYHVRELPVFRDSDTRFIYSA
jgi:hypothetical protein